MTADNDAMDKFLQRATRGFEADSPVLAGDDKRIERIERAVQRRYGKDVRRPALRRQVALLAACGLLMAGAAFAALKWADSPQEPPGRGGPAPVPPKVAPVAPSPAAVPMDPPALAEPVAPAPSVAAPATSGGAPRPAPSSKASAETPGPLLHAPGPLLTAAELFAAASRARVAGDATKAVALSEQLLKQFPSSAEATATRLSLGMLLLQQGQPARALAQFEAYERTAAGQGRAEALWGKAQALQRLGRAEEERAALRELIEKYPQAAYTGAAKKRLAALP
jgi:TolA-binding protein